MTKRLLNTNLSEILASSKQTEQFKISEESYRNSWKIDDFNLHGSYQEIGSKGFTMSQWNLNSIEDIEIITPNSADKYLCLIFLLNGTACNRYYGSCKKDMQITMERGSCNALAYQGNAVQSTISSCSPLQLIEISIKESLYDMISNYYPNICPLLDFSANRKGESTFYREQPTPISLQLKEALCSLKHIEMMGLTSTMYMDAKVLECLSLYLEESMVKPKSTNNSIIKSQYEKINMAKLILEQRYINPPSLHELALEVGTNVCTLKRVFKQLFGHTVFGYLFDYRMDMASKLLKCTDKPIQDVAQEVGYEYHTHFSSAFRQKFGTSPSAFRARK